MKKKSVPMHGNINIKFQEKCKRWKWNNWGAIVSPVRGFKWYWINWHVCRVENILLNFVKVTALRWNKQIKKLTNQLPNW